MRKYAGMFIALAFLAYGLNRLAVGSALGVGLVLFLVLPWWKGAGGKTSATGPA